MDARASTPPLFPVYLSRRSLERLFKEGREFVNARSLEGEL
jgi:hypothetical protein